MSNSNPFDPCDPFTWFRADLPDADADLSTIAGHAAGHALLSQAIPAVLRHAIQAGKWDPNHLPTATADLTARAHADANGKLVLAVVVVVNPTKPTSEPGPTESN